jgi:hypothetical protein
MMNLLMQLGAMSAETRGTTDREAISQHSNFISWI